MNIQIIVPKIENGQLSTIHWSEPSLQSFRENVAANGTWGDIIKADPLCRVCTEEKGWTDEYLSDLLRAE